MAGERRHGYTLSVGQLRVVYQATGEYMALAVRDQLEARGIHSVQLLNEIPMQPGFTFALRHWADVLVEEQQVAEARRVIADFEAAADGADGPRADWPPHIKVHTTPGLGAVWVAVLASSYILLLISNIYGLELSDIGSPRGVFIWLAPDFLLMIGLAVLNWRMLARELLAALAALAALPVLAGWLLYELARWVASEFRWLVGFGRE